MGFATRCPGTDDVRCSQRVIVTVGPTARLFIDGPRDARGGIVGDSGWAVSQEGRTSSSLTFANGQRSHCRSIKAQDPKNQCLTGAGK